MALRGAELETLTAAEKIKAMMDAFGYSREEAIAFLLDCGEINEGDEDA